MDNSINVEEIMEEIRADIKARGLVDDSVLFKDIPINRAERINSVDRSLPLKDRILAFAYFRVFLNMPECIQTFVKKMAGKNN